MYSQEPQTIKPPMPDDDVDSFMQKRAKPPAMPKSVPVDDVDDFMAKRQSSPDIVQYPKSPKLGDTISLRSGIKMTYAGDPKNRPIQPSNGSMGWTGEDMDAQGKPTGRGLIYHKPIAAPGEFKSPISMDFREPTEAQKMVDRALQASQSLSQPTPRHQALGKLRSQAGTISAPSNSDVAVTPEERKTASEQFYQSNLAERSRREAAAKAKVEEEAARAPKNTLGKMGSHFMRGAVSGIATTPLRMAAMTDPTGLGRQIFSNTAQDVENKTAEYFPVDRRNPATLNVFKPEFYSLGNIGKATTENVPEVIGQMLPQILLSRGAGGIAKAVAPELAEATVLPRLMGATTGAELASRTAAGGFGAIQQSTQAYQNAINAGMSHEQAMQAAAMEAPIGFSEFLGSPGTTGFSKPGKLIRQEAKEEGLQELGQNVAGDLVAKYGSGYGKDKSLTDITGEGVGAGLLGAATGGIMAAPGARAQSRAAVRSVVNERPKVSTDIRPTTLGPTQITAVPGARPATSAQSPTNARPQATQDDFQKHFALRYQNGQFTLDEAIPLEQAPPQNVGALVDVLQGFQTKPNVPPAMAAAAQNLLEQVQSRLSQTASAPNGQAEVAPAFPRLPEPEGFNVRRAKLLGMEVPPEIAINERIAQADKLLGSQNENDQRLGRRILKQSLEEIQKSEGYQGELGQPDGAPKPYTAVRQAIEGRLKPTPKATFDEIANAVESESATEKRAQTAPLPERQTATGALRAEADAAKIKAAEFEQSGDFANAAQTYDTTHKNLKLLRRKLGIPKTAEDVARINQIDREISAAASNRQRATVQARQMARQANAPTRGLATEKSTQVEKKAINPPVESAPLLRPETVRAPESAAPIEERTGNTVDFTPKTPARKRGGMDTENLTIGGMLKRRFPEGIRFADKGEARNLGGREGNALVGLANKNSRFGVDDVATVLHEEGLRLPDGRPFVEDGRVVATEADVLNFLRNNSKEKVGGTKSLARNLAEQEAEYYAQQENAPSRSFDDIAAEVDSPTAALQRAIDRSNEREHAMPSEGVGLVSMSPYADMVARNREAVDHLYQSGMASPEGKEIFRNLRDFATKNGIEARHLHALADDVRNYELEKARWADRGIDFSTVQSLNDGTARLRDSVLEDAKTLSGTERTALEREVAALDELFNDNDATILLERAAEGDNNAVNEFRKVAGEYGIGAETIGELIEARSPSQNANRATGQAKNGAPESSRRDTRTAQKREARSATPDEFDLLNRNPATIPKDEFDAHLTAMEKLRNDEIRGIVKLSRDDKREMFRQLRNLNEERKFRVQRKELPAKFESRTLPVDKEFVRQSVEKATQPKAREQKMPGFYSQLQRVIDAKMPAKASAAQVRAIIENPQSGIKPDEVKWTGLDDYLRSKETVTKADVQEFLKANQVEVQEVEKGDIQRTKDLEAQWKAESEHATRLALRYAPEQEIETARAQAQSTRNEINRLNQRTKYGQYTLPGAKEGSYRELLLTLPAKEAPMPALTANYVGGGEWMVKYPDGKPMKAVRAENAQDAINKAWTTSIDKKVTEAASGQYKSSHFDEPNILAHIRFNERTDSEGKKVLHVEEIQSDWHQEGRKKGYATGNEIDREPLIATLSDSGKYYEVTNADKTWRSVTIRNDSGNVSKDAAIEQARNLFRRSNYRTDAGEMVPDAPFKKNWHELAFKRALRYAAENGYDKMTWTTGEQQADRFDLSKQISGVRWIDQGDGKFGIGIRGKDGKLIANAGRDNQTPEQLEEYVGKEVTQKILKAAEADMDGELSGLDLKVGGEGMKGFYDQILPAFANKYAKKWGVKVGKTRVQTAAESKGTPQMFDENAPQAYREANDLYAEDFPAKYETVHSIDITPAMRESVMQGQALFQQSNKSASSASATLADAKIQFKSGKRGQAGALYADNGAMNIMRAAYEQVFKNKVDFENINLNKTAATEMAKVLRAEAQNSDRLPAERRKLMEVAREFERAAQSGETVSIISASNGKPFSEIKVSRRHEAFHDAQEGLSNSPGFLAKHKYGRQIIEGLQHYSFDDRTVESAAWVASGDGKAFGLTDTQGKEFLKDYFDDIVANNGREALKRFVSMAPQVQDALKAAKEQHGVSVLGQTGRVGERGTAATGSRGLRAIERTSGSGESVPGRIREQRKRFSFGELENEPRGQIAASGLGGLQNLFNSKAKAQTPAQPVPLPKNFNLANWSQKFYREAMAAGLNKADRAKYDAAKTLKEKNAAILSATTDPKREQSIFDIIDKADAATGKNDGSALYDALSEATDLMRRKSSAQGFERVKQEVGNALNLPRALMASMDISAPLRQGAILTLPPSQWGKATKATVRMFEAFSTKQYDRIGKEINLHPDAETARENGLYLSTDKSGLVTKKEEDFISNWADKIPLVKHSEQAYKTYLDSLRMDTFARYKASIDKSKGLSAEQKENAYKAAANWINVATGRGTLGQTFESAMPALSKILFAPRYTASRIQVLNPATYLKNSHTAEGRAVLKNQMADMVQYGGMVSLTLALAAAAGAKVGLDPDDADFLKIKVGDVRYDILAGLQQPMRLFYRMGESLYGRATGQKTSGQQSSLDIASRFGRSKLAPVPSFFVDYLSGRDFTGEKFKLGKAVVDRVAPLIWKDFYEAYQKEGLAGGAKMLPGLTGIGVQNYAEKAGSLKRTPFRDTAEKQGLKYDSIRQKPGEPDTVFKQRTERVNKWADEYGSKLINSPRYQALSEEDQKAALKNLHARIGRQQNLTKPNTSTLEPNAVLLGVQRSARGKAKRQSKYLYTQP